jgi:uncharacterized protein YkwD
LRLPAVLAAGAFAAGVHAAPAPDLPAVEALIGRATNELRARHARAALARDPALTRAARSFADFMARTDRYAHRADGKDPADRARARGYEHCMVSENIAYQFSSESFATAELARRFVDGWKESAGHRRNMLEPAATDMGTAVSRSARSGRYYAVQMFGRPRSRMLEFRVTNLAKRTLDYRVADKDWQLASRAGRLHTVCGPESVTFPGADEGKGRTIRPSGGENLVASGDSRIVVDVR